MQRRQTCFYSSVAFVDFLCLSKKNDVIGESYLFYKYRFTHFNQLTNFSLIYISVSVIHSTLKDLDEESCHRMLNGKR